MHKLDKKAVKLRVPDNYGSKEEYRLARESYGNIHCKLQRCYEVKCRKYRLDKLEWPPCITKISIILRIYKLIMG